MIINKIIYSPLDPTTSDPYEWARWARGMAHYFPALAKRYKEYEIQYLLEVLEKYDDQVTRGQIELRLKELGLLDNNARKSRWRAFYKKQLQAQVAKYIKTHPLKAKRIIERLKQI